MKYSNKIKNLGISKKDFKILNKLFGLKNTNVSCLSVEAQVSRTTVTFRLNKMKERGLVEKVKIGGHFEWQLTHFAKNIIFENIESDNFAIKQYFGIENIENVFLKILQNKNKSRIYFAEPYKQTIVLRKKIKPEILSSMAEAFKKSKLISEGISSSQNLDMLKTYDTKVLKSMFGRMTIIYIISDELISFNEMVIVYGNNVYLFDFVKEVLVEINNKSFAESVSKMILALKNFAQKIDLNQEIEKILKERKNN